MLDMYINELLWRFNFITRQIHAIQTNTRKILDILNTTEDKIKNGLKIKDIVPFFKNLI